MHSYTFTSTSEPSSSGKSVTYFCGFVVPCKSVANFIVQEEGGIRRSVMPLPRNEPRQNTQGDNLVTFEPSVDHGQNRLRTFTAQQIIAVDYQLCISMIYTLTYVCLSDVI